ncbi:hypothetical protein C8N43_0382 [Litoreibacter ponti]|uniref:Uncharacterized protein n=1 Tax=Litoreibacter ponti TaxID=1510457 RepID=A0A2T6BI55_9RHOB|nr:hypothetical protein [Litoreibacter ponti]PTX55740.1 hypothetical protein C8N43_0382 [Litoreibacter ponti]
MSYDLNIYLSPGPQPVPDPVEGLGWQIAVYPATPIDPDDMPVELRAAIGPRSHLVSVHLEGARTSRAEDTLAQMIEQFVLYDNAVVHDLQTDLLTSQKGVQQLIIAPPEPRPAPLVMEWIYRCAAPGRAALRERILDVIAATAPKAMPRRYGSFEPMPFTFAETGRAHLLEDWGREEWSYFWRGSAPYQWCFHHAPMVTDVRPPNEMELYEWCSMSLHVSQRILKTKKDKAAMLALFAALSEALDVVYAEIVSEADRGPLFKGYGLPPRAGLACVIGPDYAPHWPDFVEGSKAIGQHHMRDSIIGDDILPVPPETLHAPPQLDPLNNPLNTKWARAEIFPFKPLS